MINLRETTRTKNFLGRKTGQLPNSHACPLATTCVLDTKSSSSDDPSIAKSPPPESGATSHLTNLVIVPLGRVDRDTPPLSCLRPRILEGEEMMLRPLDHQLPHLEECNKQA